MWLTFPDFLSTFFLTQGKSIILESRSMIDFPCKCYSFPAQMIDFPRVKKKVISYFCQRVNFFKEQNFEISRKKIAIFLRNSTSNFAIRQI